MVRCSRMPTPAGAHVFDGWRAWTGMHVPVKDMMFQGEHGEDITEQVLRALQAVRQMLLCAHFVDAALTVECARLRYRMHRA